jgi:hypothetical protein
VVTAQHAEQAGQAFAVGGCQRAHGNTSERGVRSASSMMNGGIGIGLRPLW